MFKLLLYCHNLSGLGHIIRSLQIASAAARLDDCDCTVVTGCRHLDRLHLPAGVRIERLPVVYKQDGRLTALDPTAVPAGSNVMQVRGERILAICRDMNPDVVLVDYHPLGLRGEMLPTLNAAVDEQWPTRFVWGVPYAEGSIGAPHRPGNPRIARAVAHYDSAIAYVEPGHSDVFQGLPAWSVPARRGFVGTVVEPPLPTLPSPDRLIVVACGGGLFSLSVCERIAMVFGHLSSALHARLRIVLGPMADADAAHALLARFPGVEIRETGALRDVIRDASVVVSTAGYNSAALLIKTDLPLVFVPVSVDQRTRVQVLKEEPGVWVIDDDEPAALVAAITAALAAGRIVRDSLSALDGASTAAAWLRAAAERARARASPSVGNRRRA